MLDIVYMLVRVIAVLATSIVLLGLLSTCRTRTEPDPQVQSAELHLMMKSYKVRGKRYVPMNAQQALKYKAEGIASYYEAHGSRGSFGERMRKGEYYAAHTTLPMPCRVRITNLSNGKTCEARVVDRGPFSSKRLIDVSSAVARDLGFLRKGLQQVRVEVISVGDEPHQLKAELDD